ncbi:lipase family protein [Nocardia sp. CDC153]|uniref:lipase family protein n=1 Tax=Nocardia sp. CDC153 TaxID=3112167 RepID=UPI002DBAEA20|nr:lipase family protein [Nocardia sp. CDC153]MEC3958309.1 lipase family protein [Nocardia sp. CDC153]
MTIRNRCRTTFAAGLIAFSSIVAATVPASADTTVPLPGDDPFYRGPDGWQASTPGSVLHTRTVSLAPTGAQLPLEATQVLYATTDQFGKPDATVATVIRSPSASGPLRIVSYQTAYDSLTASCDPSYALRGGGGGAPQDAVIIAGYLAAGLTVVVSDYEGTKLAYGAGRLSGNATLDGIRAALHALDAPATTPVGMSGFSGGSIATEFAAELAPTYAPELNIIGVTAGGMPVDMAATIDYVDGSPEWALVLPYVMQGAARGFNLDLTPYLSDYGREVMTQIADHCVSNGPHFPGLRLSQLLRPDHQNYQEIPGFTRILAENHMGDTGTPTAPMLFGAGNVDGIGDGVIVAAGERTLATDFCRRGLSVQYNEYPASNHLLAALQFTPTAQAFLMDRFAGTPPADDCSNLTR